MLVRCVRVTKQNVLVHAFVFVCLLMLRVCSDFARFCHCDLAAGLTQRLIECQPLLFNQNQEEEEMKVRSHLDSRSLFSLSLSRHSFSS